MKKNIHYFKNKKNNKIPFTALTFYDFPTAQFLKNAGQVLVVNDIPGISFKVYKHVHRYLDLNSLIVKVVTEFKTMWKKNSHLKISSASLCRRLSIFLTAMNK